MDGFLIVFNTECKRDIVDINHKLFGRIAYTKRDKYYYKGNLENTKYSKITNGCYFAEDIDNNLNGKITLIKANVDLEKDKFLTAKEHWKEHIAKNNLSVKNI